VAVVLRYKSYQSSELLPGFTDITEIGSGDYATVYAAKESDSGRSVALKLLNVREISPRALQSLLRETSVLETLSAHPNIVTLRRTDVTPDGRPVLVMDLCRRSVADGAVGTRGLDPAQAVAVAIKIAGALETAHRAGMVHGCVTPHKLLVTHDGEPALADLGAARLRTFSDTAGQVDFATLHMAPEMLEGTTATTATDIYELAASLYSLLAGHAAFRTFDGEPSAAVIMRILRDPVPPLLADGVPLALSDLLVESMAKNPLKRPSSALEFADRLKRIEVAQAWPSTSYFVVDGAAYRFLEPMPADEDGAGDESSGLDLDRAVEAEPRPHGAGPVPPADAGAAEGADASSLWRALTEKPHPRRGEAPPAAGGWMSPTPGEAPAPVARHAPAPVVGPNTTLERRVIAPTPRRTVASRTVATSAPAITTNPNTGRHIVRPDPLLELLAGSTEAPGDPVSPELRPRFRDPGPRAPGSRAERYRLADGLWDDESGDDLSAQQVEEAIRRAGRDGAAPPADRDRPAHPDT
jgi:Protein kinase domain